MQRRMITAAALIGLAATACVVGGCAGRTGACAWGDVDTGLVLEYRMPEGKPLAYKLKSDFTQNMDVMGQQIAIESTQLLAFSVVPGKPGSAGQALDITIEGMNVSVSSPQGDVEADVDGVVGGTFGMMVSRLGEESGLPDSEVLQYELGPEGPRSVIPMFSAMFPDLPDHPVVVGDSWPAVVEVVDSSEGSEVTVTTDVMNTLEGFEKVMGYDCAKITTKTTGTILGTGSQMGATWTTDADLEGGGVWYFAYKEGIFVKEISEGTADGSILVDSPQQQLDMPMDRVFTMVTELKK